MKTHKTQVCIIGAGPAGLLLSHLLHRKGIDNIVLEYRTRAYVEGRVRAGLLEEATVRMLEDIQVDKRLKEQGLRHEGVIFSFSGRRLHLPLYAYTGQCVTVYGQQELVKDLIAESETLSYPLYFEAEAKQIIQNQDQESVYVQFIRDGKLEQVESVYIAGCDGFHGISRQAIPPELIKTYEKHYPFSWLGIIAEVEPSTDELIYAYHDRGFAMHSMRSPTVSRLYLQVSNDEKLEDWPDHRIWEELSIRLAAKNWGLKTGPIVEKSITPMRSFMLSPVQYGKLYLAGDAAHIVPPTGAKGLNLAAADADSLFKALSSFFLDGKTELLERYEEQVITRAWHVQEFSNYMTSLFHQPGRDEEFTKELQKAKFHYLEKSEVARRSIAENYVGKIYRQRL